MRRLNTILYLFSAAILSSTLSFASPYTVNLKSGKFPKDVTVKNENGLLPNMDGYKRGYTQDGWIVDRFGTRGYVALSPTFTRIETEDGSAVAEASLNVLTLPALTINAGDVLRWDACSILPGFGESYRVVAETDGKRVTIFDMPEESPDWSTHVVNLSDYTGKETVISFECTSVCKYMLALDGILVGAPEDLKFCVTDNNSPYLDNESAPGGYAPMTFDILNAGKTVESGKIEFDVAYKSVGEVNIDSPWVTGETRTFTFSAPLTMDKRTAYELLYINKGQITEPEVLAEGSLFLSNFARNLVVDKATGMWCTNCPEGNLVLDKLSRRFRNNLIELDTHQNDVLANEDYFTDLKFSALPYMMLNRARNSAASNDNLFTSYYYQPVMWEADVDAVSKSDNESVSVSVRVRSAEDTDNSTDRYRVGYVVTSDFFMPDNKSIYQINGMTTTSGEQYYYLPNKIQAPLLKFRHVTLTHDYAFGGIPGSIPASVEKGKDYLCGFSVDRPRLLRNLSDGNIAVFILDTMTGEILNAGTSSLKDDFSGINNPVADRYIGRSDLMTVGDNGRSVLFNLPEDSDYTFEVFTLTGAKAMERSGKIYAGDKIRLSLPGGVYIYRLNSPEGVRSRKIVIK